jgi:hypothetical protein
MSKNAIKISTLVKEVLSEVGDLRNIEPLSHDKNKQTFQVPYKGQEYTGKVTFTFMNKKGLGLFKLPPIVNVDSIDTGYNVGYSIEGVSSQFLKSDIKLLLSILKTVSVIVGDFVSKHPQAIYFIFAENKTGIGFDDKQKLTVYQQILGQNLPKGFRMGKAEIEGVAQGLFIVKKD